MTRVKGAALDYFAFADKIMGMNLAVSFWGNEEPRQTICYLLADGLEGSRLPLFSWWIRSHYWDFECGGVRGKLQQTVEGVDFWFDAADGVQCRWKVEKIEGGLSGGRHRLFDGQQNSLCGMETISFPLSEWEPVLCARLRQGSEGTIDFFAPGGGESFRSLFRRGTLQRCGQLVHTPDANLFPLFLTALACFLTWDPFSD